MIAARAAASLALGAGALLLAGPAFGQSNLGTSLPAFKDGIEEVYEKQDGRDVWGSILSALGYGGFNKSYAVVIGVSDYEHLNDLPTKGDALRMRDYFINDANFDVVFTLTGKKATKARVQALMSDELPSRLGRNDRLVFYWSGHGVTRQMGGDRAFGFLPLHDSDPDRISNMIAMSELSTWDSYLSAGQVLYLLDSCFSGLAGIATKNDASVRDMNLNQLMGPSRHLLAAGTADQETFAHANLGGSVFTTAVLDGLRGAADASNAYGKDDIVSLGELKEYVATRVEHERLNYRWSKPITPQLRDMTVNTGAFFFAVPTGKFGIRRGVQMRQNVAGTAVGKSDDIVLARVGDEEITRGHVRAVWQDLPAEYKNLPEDVLFSGLVEQIADQMMLAKLIDQRKMPEELRARLRAQRLSILASAASQNVVAADITEAAIEAAYQERYANAPRAIEYNAAHILLTSETRADEVLARLRAGEDFGEVAKQVSTGPSGPNGGELGWFAQDMMVPEFGSFVAELEVGATDGPVQTQFGWHLVKLNDRRLVQPPPLVDVRDDLVQDLTQGAIDNALTRLKLDVTLERLVDAPPEGLFAQ